MIEKIRGYAPDFLRRWKDLARAYQLRYLSRQPIRLKDGGMAVKLFNRAMRSSPRILLGVIGKFQARIVHKQFEATGRPETKQAVAPREKDDAHFAIGSAAQAPGNTPAFGQRDRNQQWHCSECRTARALVNGQAWTAQAE